MPDVQQEEPLLIPPTPATEGVVVKKPKKRVPLPRPPKPDYKEFLTEDKFQFRLNRPELSGAFDLTDF